MVGIYVFQKGRRRGRSHLRWLDRIESDTKKADVEDDNWRTAAQNRRQERKVAHKATESCRHPHLRDIRGTVM